MVLGMVFGSVGATAVAGASTAARQQPAAGAGGDERLDAVVLEVHGHVKRAPVGVSPADKAGWTPVRVGDRLPPGTQIKTGAVRSDVVLRFGDDTVIQVRKMTLASIEDFLRDPTGQTVRLNLGYGAVRGGSVESELRSDLVVDSTVATLAKRGTEGLGMEVEPSSMFFEARLTRSGFLSLLSRLAADRREIRPGEYANADNIGKLPIEQKLLDLKVRFYSDESTTEGEASFASRNTTGNAVLSPGSGTEAGANGLQSDASFVTGVITRRNPPQPSLIPPPPPPGLSGLNRPEGDFGVPDTFSGVLGDVLPFLRTAQPARIAAPRPGAWTASRAHSVRRVGVGRVIKSRSAPRR